MSSTFNPQILMGKLAKLNSSQQSIETLSHWCIFHMNKAKNVVETWDRQFHSSPREQRLAFLYLANDILQNSRRKGSEFVGEFWKVLPNALRDVIGNGDELGRNAALRLINIWEERKVFGSRGQLLKEELVGRNLETSTRNENHPPGFKLRNSAGNGLDKVISAYQIVYGGQLDEDTILSKCRNAIFCIEKVGKEIDGDRRSEQLDGFGIVEEIKGQHAILLGCIQQLTVMESSRANLVSHLREALREQDFRLNHVRYQLQAAQSQSEHASNLCRQFQNSVQLPPEQSMKKTRTSKVPQSFMAGSGEQTAPVMYTQQVPCAVKPEPLEEDFKSGAAAAAAQLTSSGQIPTYILSSLTTEGVIVSATKESSNDYPPEKKPKLENDHSVYIPSQNPQPPVPPFPYPDSLKPAVSITSKEIIPEEQPPLPTSPPPMPPLPTSPPPMYPYPVPQFMQNAGSIPSVPYGYATTPQQPQPFPYPTVGTQFTGIPPFPAPPANSYHQSYQTEGGFYGQQPSFSNAPISRQL